MSTQSSRPPSPLPTQLPSGSTPPAPSSLPAVVPAKKPLSEAALAKKAQREELKKQKELDRKKRKEERKSASETLNDPGVPSKVADAPLRFKPREWANVESEGANEQSEGTRMKVMSWNMLAQALVRRELFPGSDFLKVKERIPTLMQEVLYYAPSIICLQEVDRLSDHLPSLSIKYDHKSFIGYRDKPHGLLIAFKRDEFHCIAEKGIRLDEIPIFGEAAGPSHQVAVAEQPPNGEEKGGEDDAVKLQVEEGKVGATTPTLQDATYDPSTSSSKAFRKACGLSRVTRNVGLLIALKHKNRAGGVVVGTTHLFWHPSHVYERVRQTGILMREARKFREEQNGGEFKDWEIIMAGDFNTQPCESSYRLLMDLPLTSAQEDEITRSTVIHQSIDKLHDPDFVPPEAAPPKEGEEEDLSQHPDRIIKNCRVATPEDGLIDVDGLKKLFQDGRGGNEGPVRSAYGQVYGSVAGEEDRWYCSRPPGVQSGGSSTEAPTPETPEDVLARRSGAREDRIRRGDFEPIWTNYTPLWRCTLDYIFLLPPASSTPEQSPTFQSVLKLHPVDALGPGLPLKGIEPSDHLAIGTVIHFP